MRDLGGLETGDGRLVKKGLLFRSDELDRLTAGDLKKLADLSIRSLIDFRTTSEVAEARDRKPPSLHSEFNISVAAEPGDVLQALSWTPCEELMERVYLFLVNHAQDDFRRFFAIVAERENAPLLFHCAAGKDRTGFAAYMLLRALGVSHQDAIDDYLYSTEALGDKYAPLLEIYPDAGPLIEVRPQYIDLALKTIDEDYGGLNAYLRQNLKIDPEKLRDIYLQ